MDQDDISSPERFQVQYNYLEKNPEVDLVATRCITINEEDDIIGALKYTPDNVSLVSKPGKLLSSTQHGWVKQNGLKLILMLNLTPTDAKTKS